MKRNYKLIVMKQVALYNILQRSKFNDVYRMSISKHLLNVLILTHREGCINCFKVNESQRAETKKNNYFEF